MLARRIVFWNISDAPDGLWTVQQFRNLAIVHDGLPRHLIHDRDSKFSLRFRIVLEDFEHDLAQQQR